MIRQRAPDRPALHPQRAAVDELVEPGRQHRGPGAVDLRAGDRSLCAAGIRGAQQQRARAGRVEDQLQLHLGGGGPALEVARGKSAEVGVGVDGRAVLEVQGVALPVRLAAHDAGVHLVGHLRAGSGEQPASHD